MSKEVPNGWTSCNLKDIGKIISGGTPSTTESSYWGNDIAWITPADLSGYTAKQISRGRKSISNEGLKNSSARMLPKGSVLFSSRAPIGYVAIASNDLATNQGFKSIVPNKDIDSNYLYYYLKHNKRLAEESASGTTFKEISGSKFSELPFVYPLIPEQHQIVEKIEELFSELDKGIENLKTAQQQLKVYRQAVLKWAFEGKLTNGNVKDGELPEGWEWVSITDLAAKRKHALKAGPFGSSLKKEFYVERGYKIYGQEQVISGDAFYGDYYINEEKYQELNSNKVHAGDVLISLVGTVGKVLVLPENCPEGIINPRLIKITLATEKYIPKFFKYYFESSTVKSYYSSKAQGTTMDVLNLGIIKTIPFPLCLISQQEKVILEIESRLSVCDKMEETISTSLQQAEALRQSILKRAFEGKLVKAEAKVVNLDVLIKTEEKRDWQRKVLAGKIIEICYKDNNFGHTKFQKTLQLCEYHAQVEFNSRYIKDVAGPFDKDFFFPFIEEGRVNDWFTEKRKQVAIFFKPGTEIKKLVQDYDSYFKPVNDNEIQFVINLLKDKTTFESELISTIYAIWNNYLINGLDIDSDLLITEVYEWSESKIKFSESDIIGMWQWMNDVRLIPVGFGKLINEVG